MLIQTVQTTSVFPPPHSPEGGRRIANSAWCFELRVLVKTLKTLRVFCIGIQIFTHMTVADFKFAIHVIAGLDHGRNRTYLA